MFNTSALTEFYGQHQQLLSTLEIIRKNLTARFYDSETAINGILLSALTNLPCLLSGPPGVGKSKLIRTFCEMIGINTGEAAESREYFEYLLTKFTEPTELFGSFKLEPDGEGGQSLNRIDTGMLHNCRVAFLDEVFNGSSAILNTLLALMNERRFHDRGEIRHSSLEMIFGATNFPPTSQELRAVYDRFVIRVHMDNVARTPDVLGDYLNTAMATQRPLSENEIFPQVLEQLGSFRADLAIYEQSATPEKRLYEFDSEAGQTFLYNLSFLTEQAVNDQVASFSNRRIFQLLRAMSAQRLMRAHREEGPGNGELVMQDYEIIWTHFLDRPEVSGDRFDRLFDTRLATTAPAA